MKSIIVSLSLILLIILYIVSYLRVEKEMDENDDISPINGGIDIENLTLDKLILHNEKVDGNEIIKMGGNIYYSDTDSIVTDIELLPNMVDLKSLGKLKTEHRVIRGYFISAKTYCLITEGKGGVKVAKGLNSKTLK
jgi:hypothetical protein